MYSEIEPSLAYFRTSYKKWWLMGWNPKNCQRAEPGQKNYPQPISILYRPGPCTIPSLIIVKLKSDAIASKFCKSRSTGRPSTLKRKSSSQWNQDATMNKMCEAENLLSSSYIKKWLDANEPLPETHRHLWCWSVESGDDNFNAGGIFCPCEKGVWGPLGVFETLTFISFICHFLIRSDTILNLKMIIF